MLEKHKCVTGISFFIFFLILFNCNEIGKNNSETNPSATKTLKVTSILFPNGNFNNTYSNYDKAFSDNDSGINVDLSSWIKITFSKKVNTESVTTEVRDEYLTGGNLISNGSIYMRRTHIGNNIVDQNDPKNIVILKVIAWLKCNKKLILRPLNQHYTGNRPSSENYYGTKPNSTYSINFSSDIKDTHGKPINLKKINSFSYTTSDIDWGLYFMSKKQDDGYVYSEKYVPGRENEFFHPDERTMFWTHGYEINSTKDDCRRENLLYHIPNGNNGSWQGHDVLQYIVDDGWNFAVFYWNQFADEPSHVKDCEAKIWNTFKRGGNANDGRYGIRYNTQTNYGESKFVEIDDAKFKGPIEPLAVEFYKQYLSAMKNNLSSKRIIGHSNGGQLVIPVAWLISKNIFEGNIKETYRLNRLVIQEAFWSRDNKSYLNAPENARWGFSENLNSANAVQHYVDNIKSWEPAIAIEQDKSQGRLCGDKVYVGAKNFELRKKTCITYIYPNWIADDGINTKYRHLYSKKYYFWTYEKLIHDRISNNGGVTSRTEDSVINRLMNNGVDNKVFKHIDTDSRDGNNKKTPYPGDDEFERLKLVEYY